MYVFFYLLWCKIDISMQRLITLLIFLLVSILSFGQEPQSRVDSLLVDLDKAKDSDKVGILIELTDHFLDREIGYEYATEALKIATRLNQPRLRADALFILGRYYNVNYQENDALKPFNEALSIYTSIKDQIAIIDTKRNIGRTYRYLKSFDLAEQFTLQSLALAKEIDERVKEAEALLDYGDILIDLNKCTEGTAKQLEALAILQEHGSPNELYSAYNKLGGSYFHCGEYRLSIEAYLREIEIRESLNDLQGVAMARHNLGRTHRVIGNFQLAIEQYQISLKLSEQLGKKNYIAANSSEIGLVYESLSRSQLAVEENEQNYRRALMYHKEALALYREMENQGRVAESLNNIANISSLLAMNKFVAEYGEEWEDSLTRLNVSDVDSVYQSTFDYYYQALDIFNSLDNTKEIINVNINLGSHYIYIRDWAKVRHHLNTAFDLARQINSQYDIALIHFYFGEYHSKLRNFNNAEQSFLLSLKISEDLGIKDLARHTHQKLSKVYENTANLTKAIEHIKSFNKIKDELFSEQSQKIITEMQTKYETEKKEQEIKLLNNEKELQRSVIQRQKLTIAISIIGIIVILAFAGLLINMVRQKQRANRILEEKNVLISHQKQEITDSIRYASRIQTAILPTPVILKEALKDHFVLFLPRDIVSGDFYWFTKQQNKMVLVAADCTGHGVPGAFMSMLGVSFLYEIVNKEGIMQPAEILNRLREFVKLTLSQTGKKDEQKDGMDISLSTLDLDNMKLQWAGAYNPLILIRDSEVIEYKADKMPVAIHITDHMPFTNHEIDLQPNDAFYMFSDGFPDQFGGAEGRKYMSKRFKQFLLDIHQKPMEEQKEILHQEHLAWRGDMEQIDDIVVFGVRV